MRKQIPGASIKTHQGKGDFYKNKKEESVDYVDYNINQVIPESVVFSEIIIEGKAEIGGRAGRWAFEYSAYLSGGNFCHSDMIVFDDISYIIIDKRRMQSIGIQKESYKDKNGSN